MDFIINFNVPTRAKDYVHRVGRTARAGRGGFALTLVTQFDVKLFHAVEDHISKSLRFKYKKLIPISLRNKINGNEGK